ncbi:MAG: ATP-binding protein [Candidatus Pacebacteria bacterium]|nr:ATP-binding protein [Candidatus Paceibacterota bacterium]
MSIQGKISPRIIQSISTLYNDTNRVILEFIDNSIDSAEEYFDSSNNGYIRPIKIILEIDGKNNKDGVVSISDNCKGMFNIEKIVQNIGNSDKKAQPWTNGQFGYGMCSFIACCSELKVVSRFEKGKIFEINILKDHFLVDDQKDFLFSDPIINSNFEYDTGTKVVLKMFGKSDWKDIDIKEIQVEIEKHFELLLNRTNLEIKLISNGNESICKPFDYSLHEGREINEYLENSFNSLLCIDKPIHLFIKVTEGKDVNKRPIFIVKGRRIAEIKDIKAFKSKNKSDIWNHPNITGYIDLGKSIEPDISRINGFSPQYKDKMNIIFNWLISKESDILDLIKEDNESTQEKHYQQLEDILSKALSKIARIDSMNFRTDIISGKELILEKGAIGSGIGISAPLPGSGELGGEGGGGSDFLEGDNPDDQLGGNKNLAKESDSLFDDKEPEGKKRRKSGFNIKISDLEPNVDINTEKQIKSRLIGDTIEIFKKHPEFEKRVGHFRGGRPKITQRLITYLAGEITVHYKDRFYSKTGQPEYNIKMFESLVESIYLFEDLLRDFVEKDLSSWNK